MPGLAHHQVAVELAQLGIINLFGEHLETLAASRLDHGTEQYAVHQALLAATVLAHELHELVHVVVVHRPLRSEHRDRLRLNYHVPLRRPDLRRPRSDDRIAIDVRALPTLVV